MKILHLNKYDSGGGAFTACQRLHLALMGQGVNSWVLCEVPSGRVRNSLGIRRGVGRGGLAERVRGRLRYEVARFKSSPFFVEPNCHTTISLNFLSNNLSHKIDEVAPDIIHMHWVGNGFLRIEDLPKITRKYPVVWTLHDMWPFCGAEHCAYTEQRWKYGYTRESRCEGAKGPDLNRWVWQRKMKAWSGEKIHTIAVSAWIRDCVRSSRLFSRIKGESGVIFNGLDRTVFRPAQRHNPKYPNHQQSAIPGQPWRIAFGAVSQDNKIKGGDLLVQSLHSLLNAGHSFEIITFGKGELPGFDKMPIYNRGYIDSETALAALYGSVDVMVVPSRMESFGQVAAEALACGTPVVSFDTTGLRDIVDHKVNGYRAKCFDPLDLAKGIRWCVESPDRHRTLCRRARETATHRFCVRKVAAQTIQFYERILSERRGHYPYV